MVVIGGYNSSNTCNLARICAAAGSRPSTSPSPPAWCPPTEIRHRPVASATASAPPGTAPEIVSTGWLRRGPLSIGLTAGASTPNNIIGDVVQRLVTFAGA